MDRPPPFRARRPRPAAVHRRWGLVRVAGESMRPTLRPGDVLLLDRAAAVRQGDVVVADLPGDRGPGVKRALRLEPDGWWLERDSATRGTDSWLFGAVPPGDVRGVVRARVWPRPGRLPRPPR